MAKQISIYYSVRANLEKVIEVEDDFVFKKQNNLKESFDELLKRYPSLNLNTLDEVELENNPEYYDNDSFNIDGIEVIGVDNLKVESILITK
jgi:hypothetical protein